MLIIAVSSPLGTLSCSGHIKIFHIGRICMHILLEPQGISFKENKKHITKFLKNESCRMKISKHVESNIYKCIEVLNFA